MKQHTININNQTLTVHETVDTFYVYADEKLSNDSVSDIDSQFPYTEFIQWEEVYGNIGKFRAIFRKNTNYSEYLKDLTSSQAKYFCAENLEEVNSINNSDLNTSIEAVARIYKTEDNKFAIIIITDDIDELIICDTLDEAQKKATDELYEYTATVTDKYAEKLDKIADKTFSDFYAYEASEWNKMTVEVLTKRAMNEVEASYTEIPVLLFDTSFQYTECFDLSEDGEKIKEYFESNFEEQLENLKAEKALED